MFKTRLDTFGNIFGHFWNFGTFLSFFEVLRSLEPPWNTGKKNFENFDPKQVQNTFGYFWERFWAFLEFSNFLIFLKFFEDSTLHGTLGKKIFRKVCPKTRSKHIWILLGTILGILGNLKLFLIFLKIFEDSTFHGKLGKNFSKSLPQNTFKTCLDTFGNTFGHFWKFENFFFENFRKLDPPRNTGQKKISKNLTQNKFKTRLDAFGNDFGHFWNFAIFF